MRKITVVDVTLRDGGYINNYGFTLQNVRSLSSSLEDAGVKMIEIGHGYGLGAERTLGKMACTDEKYIGGLQGRLKRAKFGMFAMAGICTVEDIKKAKRLNLDFIRIGFVGMEGEHGLDKCIPLLKTAISNGLWVSANILKFNIYTLDEISNICKKLEKIGVKNVYLVDSTGGIFPDETKKYIQAIKKKFKFNLGIHAHQNLDLGVANSIEAVKSGATFIDGTLRGIGRDAGNAQLEILVAVLKRMNCETGINLYRLLEISKTKFAKIIKRENGINEDCIMLGFTKVHSMALSICKRLGKKYELDWKDILQYLNKKNIKFEDEKLIEKYVQEMKKLKGALN